MTKLQNPETWDDCSKKQNFVSSSTLPRRKQNKQIKASLLPKLQKIYNTLVPYLLQFSVAKSPGCNLPKILAVLLIACIASSGISSVAHHNPYINIFVAYNLMQEFCADKIHYFNFLSTSDKSWLDQLKIITIL